VLRHRPVLNVIWPLSGQTEVRNAQLAVLADQQVARLQVAMDDFVVVQIFHAAHQLEEEVFEVTFCKRLLALNDTVEVGV
jgi:hypothetical protein